MGSCFVSRYFEGELEGVTELRCFGCTSFDPSPAMAGGGVDAVPVCRRYREVEELIRLELAGFGLAGLACGIFAHGLGDLHDFVG